MRFLQAGHPGTTTPLPPCATEGGSSTKQSKSCRRISFCRALSSSDFFTDGSLRFECRGNGEHQSTTRERPARQSHRCCWNVFAPHSSLASFSLEAVL